VGKQDSPVGKQDNSSSSRIFTKIHQTIQAHHRTVRYGIFQRLLRGWLDAQQATRSAGLSGAPNRTIWCPLKRKSTVLINLMPVIVHCLVHTEQSGAHADREGVELPNEAPMDHRSLVPAFKHLKSCTTFQYVVTMPSSDSREI
jgi:hypothetical protein